MVRTLYCIRRYLASIYNVFRVCYIRWIGSEVPFAAWVDMALHGALWRALKTSDKKPEHVCAWCWGILEWHSLTIYSHIYTVHTYNKLIINIMDMQFCVYSGALVYTYIHIYIRIVLMAWLWPSYWTLLDRRSSSEWNDLSDLHSVLKMIGDLCCHLVVASMLAIAWWW